MTWESGCSNCCAPFKTQKVVQKVVVPKTTATVTARPTSNNYDNSKAGDKFKNPRKKFKVVDIISKIFNLDSPQSKLIVKTMNGGEEDYVPGEKKSYFPLCGVCAELSMKLYKLYEQLETRRHKNSHISFKIKERGNYSSSPVKIGPGPWVKVNRLQPSMNNISSTQQQQQEEHNYNLLQENKKTSDHDNSPLCNHDDDDENFIPRDEDHNNNDSSSSEEKVSLPTPRKSSKNKSYRKSLKNKSPRKSKISKKIKESLPPKNKKESTVPETPSLCPLCPTTLDTLSELVNHVRYTHTTKESPLTCPICQKVTTRKIGLRTHLISIHLRPTIFPCPSCEKSYSSTSGLYQHSLTHLAPEFARKHLCHECGKGFSTGAKLKIHSVSHTGETPFGCPDCPDKKFRYIEQLKVHRLRHHSVGPLVPSVGPIPKNKKSSSFLLCPICGKQIVSRANMTIHMRVHDNTKPYECPWKGCTARFRQQTQRQTHMQVHTGERPFVCPNSGCGASFGQRPGLKKHLIIHVGDRPYKCLVENCGASFGDTGQLTYHRRVHQVGEATIDPPSFSCVKCECKFATKRAKTSHEAVCESQ